MSGSTARRPYGTANAAPPQLHYHIRWSRVVALDWECFNTFAEAEARAKELVRQDETYVIEEHNQSCARCAVAFKLKSSDHKSAETPTLKYRWQEPVMDAFTEERPDLVPGKVNAAQRAISARLCATTPADLDEKIALREALQSLRALVSEPKKESPERHKSGEKKATA